MSKSDVAQFFENVYGDRKLQGALHAALCQAAPELVVEIAASKGHKFTADELKEAVGKGAGAELSQKDLEAVAGGAIGSLSSSSLRTNFWGNILGGFGDLRSSFGLTIPGPSFVHVQSPEDGEPRVDEDGPKPSALELYEEIR